LAEFADASDPRLAGYDAVGLERLRTNPHATQPYKRAVARKPRTAV
jgi:hypothetical protein